MNYKKFVHPDSNGNPWGIVSAEQLWANVYALKYNRPENRLDSKIWEGLFNQAKATAIEFGADSDELTSGPNCIAIGFFDDQPCALTVVQINKETGWSRISYMGLTTNSRGKDLGKWVHRHGFTMMKNQGGKLYHGGTLTHNYAMRKLFESHGCHVFCEMEEWSCNLKGGTHEAVRS